MDTIFGDRSSQRSVRTWYIYLACDEFAEAHGREGFRGGGRADVDDAALAGADALGAVGVSVELRDDVSDESGEGVGEGELEGITGLGGLTDGFFDA